MVQRFIRRSGEFELNTQTRNGQAAPSLAATSNGGFIAVWSDGSGIGGDLFDTGIKGQRFDSAGNKIGAEFLVNTTTRQIQNASHVTVLSSGKFVVTWTDLQVVDNGVISDIRGRLFNADGTPAGNEFVVNTAPSKSGGSDVVALSGGGFVVTWADGSQQGGDANGQAIHGQVFSAAGARVGAEFVANTTTAGSQVAPTIGALASGGFVISWGDSSQTGGDTSLSAIRLQMFSALGAKVGTEKLVNTVTDQAQTLPSITTLKSGGFAVFWTDASKLADTSGTGIKGQLYDSAGAKVGGEFLVNTLTDGDQRRARASGLPDGGFIVTWESSTASASGVDIKAQIFDATGKKVGAEFFVEASTIGNQVGQHVATLSSGDIVLAWADSIQTGADASGSAIRARIIGAGSAVPSDIALSNAVVSETSAANYVAGTLSSTGALNSKYTYTLVSDSTGGAFRIENDKLIVQNSSLLNYETAKTAQLRVRTTDDDGNSFEETLQLSVTDSPEQGHTGGAEFLTNTVTQGNQSAPVSARLADGSMILLYRSSPALNISGGKGKILNSDGNPLSGELPIDASAVAGLPGGGFVTIGAASGGSGAALHFYTSSGAPTGSEAPILSGRGANQAGHSLAVLGSGGIVVVWEDITEPGTLGDSGPQIRGQLFGASGTPIGTDFIVVSGVGSPQLPEVTGLPSGRFVVTWQDEGSIRGIMYTADGSRLGNEFVVDPGTAWAIEPHVAALASGGFVVTWAANESSGGFAGIGGLSVQIFNAEGEKVGGPILLGDVSQVFSIDVEALSWGGFVVTWAGYDDAAAGNVGIRAQVFDASGTRLGAEMRVNVATAGEQVEPHAQALESGAFLISWTDRNPAGDGSGFSVKSRIFTPVMPGSVLDGTTGPDNLKGTAVADRLSGLAGDDILDGRAGSDTMTGGDGNDIYYVGSAGDKVVEASATGGIDTVRSAISYTLGANVENLVLTGAAAINGKGNALANGLTGNAAANLLDGAAGADIMTGGAGADVYVVDNVGDKAVETAAGGGIDTVRSAVTFTLGTNLENLVLTGTAAVNGTGNAIGNAITGNAAVNNLSGLGGNDVLDGAAGADTMTGGDGNDSYFVDNGGDVVTEASATGGTDVVNSSVSFTLGANLEKLVLTGTLAINGTGNGLANTLTGNAAANSLNGGAGADAMAGGDGNDLYFVDDAGDKAIEARSAGGTDGVSSSVSFTLGAFVENLTLSGASAVNGTGNDLANVIVGNGAGNILSGAAGADTLRGGSGGDELHGGIGFDTLQGDGGSDRFVFDTALLSTNIDHIVDFTRGSDKIVLDDAVFRGLAVGAVPSGAIVIGTSATAPDDRIIYDPGTGALFFDRDGSGTAAAAIQFATLDNKPATLTANDFLVI